MKPLMMMKALPSLECEKYRYNLLYSNIYVFLFVQIQTACIGINLVQICFFRFVIYYLQTFFVCSLSLVQEICLEIAKIDK